MSKFLYGIDFGTTNSALSIFDEEKREIVKTLIIPSVLYFPFEQVSGEDVKYFVGNEASQQYLADGMRGRFMKSVKRILPRSSFTETRISNQKMNASDLVSLILKELKTEADKIIGFDCRKAVIGRPAFFDDDEVAKDELAQQRLKKAAEKAGFTDMQFQFEPIAAAFAYEKNITKKERVLVADLGGGTTDFTFVELDPLKAGEKNRRRDIIATGGIYIGGDSFDSAFMWDRGTPYFGRGDRYESQPGKMLELPSTFFTNICSWEKMNFFNGQKVKNDLRRYYAYTKNNRKFKNLITLTEHNLGFSIFQSIEKTKIELSTSNSSVFSYSNLEIDIHESVSLSQYNAIIGKDILKIGNYLDEFLNRNNIKKEDIDSLFFTGGTSQVAAVQDLFRSKFPTTPINSGDNFISVAQGLAYSGYLF